MVSAFASANGVVMGQVKTDEKSNEITAIPQLLNMLELKGCLEYREFQVCPASELPEKLKAAWPALTTLGMATTYRVEKHKRAVLEQRYFISSAALGAERLSRAVREHWGIENQLHWVLDVSLGEDACQIYRGNAATNLATMRHFSLNMLRAEKCKMSIRRKQRQALMNVAYLDAVLEAGMSVVVK